MFIIVIYNFVFVKIIISFYKNFIVFCDIDNNSCCYDSGCYGIICKYVVWG